MQNNLFKHGFRKHPLYVRWALMKQRCLNPNAINYPRYGGKGVTVCADWMDFTAFRDWALSHGWNRQLVLDRIDNRKGYSPSNCRFVTRKESTRHRPNFVTLSAQKAQAIRTEVQAGKSHRAIASQFGTSADMISKIKRGKNWL